MWQLAGSGQGKVLTVDATESKISKVQRNSKIPAAMLMGRSLNPRWMVWSFP